MRAHSAPLKQISSRIAEADGAAPFKRVFGTEQGPWPGMHPKSPLQTNKP